MLFRWLSGAILTVEGADLDAETFESAYFAKYQANLEEAETRLGWPAEKQATAYGEYQILGENLARVHGLGVDHLPLFLSSPDMQRRVARDQFYRMLEALIQRRGPAWPKYLLSMWNAGINYNQRYTDAMLAALKRRNS